MVRKATKIVCPDCKSIIPAESKFEIGDIFECPNCGTEVEIQSLDPLIYAELLEEK